MGLLASAKPTQETGQPKAGLINRGGGSTGGGGLLRKSSSSIQGIDDFKARISSVESGGKYGALGPVLSTGMYAGDRAYGKYQVMGKNLPEWGKQYLGRPVTPQEYLANPQLQEELATKRFQELYGKHGNWEDVASVWFTGKTRAQAGGSVKDVLGTTNDQYIARVTGTNPNSSMTPRMPAPVAPRPAPVATPAPVAPPATPMRLSGPTTIQAPKRGAFGLLKDTVLGIPQAAVDVAKGIGNAAVAAGQSSLRALATVPQGLQKIGSVPMDVVDPAGKPARDAARQTLALTPEGQFQEDLYGTNQRITPESVGNEIPGLEGTMAAAPAGFLMGGLDLIPGGKVTKDVAVQALKNIDKVDDAATALARVTGIATSVAKKYAGDAARLTDDVSLSKLVDSAIAESQDAVAVARRTGAGIKNLFRGADEVPVATARGGSPVQGGMADSSVLPEVPLPQRAVPNRQMPQGDVALFDDATRLKTSKMMNVDTLNISTKGKDVIRKTVEEVRPLMEAKIGKTLTNDEALKMAEQTGRVMTRAVGREETLEWEAQMLRARQKLAQASETGTVDREYIENLITIKTQAADIGRKLQSFSIKADARTTTPKDVVLDAVLKVSDDVDEILKQAEGVDFNNLAEATKFYRKFIKPTAGEWVDLVRYNSMLSSPKTHIINALGGNLPSSLILAPIQKAVQGGLDFLKTGFTGKERQYFAGEAGVYLKNYFTSVGQAGRRFGQVMAGKRGFTDTDLRSIPVAVGGVKGAIASTLAIPTRLLEASDQFFTTMVEAGELGSLQYRARKGVKGLGNLETRAADAATYRLYRQDPHSVEQGMLLDAIDVFTTIVQQARNSPNPITSTIAKFTLPFVRTPMNIFKQGIEYSPLGFANLVGMKKGGGVGLAGDMNEQLAKAIIGSSVFAGAATMLMSNRLTWAEPEGERRNEYRAMGMQPYSVKIGDTWYSYQKLPPALAFPFAMVAAIDDSLKNRTIDESTADTVLGFIGNYANFMKDQSYVKGIGEIINGEYGLEGIVSNYATQLVPFRALGGWLARLSDPTQRQVDRDTGFIDQQVQQLMLSIPGLSDNVAPRLDPQGNPIPQPSPIGNAFSPVGFKTQTPEQAADYQEIERIRLMKRNSSVEGEDLNVRAEEIAKQALAMPREQAIVFLNEQAGTDPVLRDKVKAEIKSLKQGLTPVEKAMKSLGVADGSRAQYIAEQVKGLGTREEKIAYLDSLVEKGIITAEVKAQIRQLLASS